MRYAVTQAWPSDGLAVPVADAGRQHHAGRSRCRLLVVLLARARPTSRLVRPLLGTGFLGAYTTFSSVVVAADQQVAHGHVGTAIA